MLQVESWTLWLRNVDYELTDCLAPHIAASLVCTQKALCSEIHILRRGRGGTHYINSMMKTDSSSSVGY
jgi:hypothetical protein